MPTYTIYKPKRKAPLVAGILLASSAAFFSLGGSAQAEAGSAYTAPRHDSSYVQGAEYQHDAKPKPPTATKDYGKQSESYKQDKQSYDSDKHKDQGKKEDPTKHQDNTSHAVKPVQHETKQYEPKKEYSKPEPQKHEYKPVEHKQEYKPEKSYKSDDHKKGYKDHSKYKEKDDYKHQDKHADKDKSRQTSYGHDSKDNERHDDKSKVTKYQPKEQYHAPVYKAVAHKDDHKDKRDGKDKCSWGSKSEHHSSPSKHDHKYTPAKYSDKHEYKDMGKEHAKTTTKHAPMAMEHHKDGNMPVKHHMDSMHNWKPVVHSATYHHPVISPQHKPDEPKDTCKHKDSPMYKPTQHYMPADKHDTKYMPTLVEHTKQTHVLLTSSVSYKYEQSIAYHMASPHGMTTYSAMTATSYAASYSYMQQSNEHMAVLA